MKQIITSIMAAGALALAGCPTAYAQPTSPSPKSAIESVYAQRAKLKEKPVHIAGGKNLTELMNIDVSRCPADFRSAWFDYLVAVDQMHLRMKHVAGIASAVGKPVKNVPSLIRFAATDSALGRYLLDELSRLDDAWGKVERVGMNYGAMPTVGKAATKTSP